MRLKIIIHQQQMAGNDPFHGSVPVFGTDTALAEQVSDPGIASPPAETGATTGPV